MVCNQVQYKYHTRYDTYEYLYVPYCTRVQVQYSEHCSELRFYFYSSVLEYLISQRYFLASVEVEANVENIIGSTGRSLASTPSFLASTQYDKTH